MTLQDITSLIDRLEASSIAHLEWESDGARLVLKKAAPAAVHSPAPAAPAAPHSPAPAAPAPQPPAAIPVDAPAAQPQEGCTVKAPLVGTFYAAPSPDAAPFVQVGQAVKKGDTLCLIEAMKMMNEIPAPVDGVVQAVLAENGEVVGFDAPLFCLKEPHHV